MQIKIPVLTGETIQLNNIDVEWDEAIRQGKRLVAFIQHNVAAGFMQGVREELKNLDDIDYRGFKDVTPSLYQLHLNKIDGDGCKLDCCK